LTGCCLEAKDFRAVDGATATGASLNESAGRAEAEFGDFGGDLSLPPAGAFLDRGHATPTRRCHSDPNQLRGPYPSWIRKAGSKTMTRTLSPDELQRYEPLFDNTRRLRELINELETLAVEVLDHAQTRGEQQRRPPRSRR
jgi:hypothetical protein